MHMFLLIEYNIFIKAIKLRSILKFYNLLIKTRVKNKRTNLGSMYFENTYIIIVSNIKANITWLIK